MGGKRKTARAGERKGGGGSFAALKLATRKRGKKGEDSATNLSSRQVKEKNRPICRVRGQ